MSYVVVAVAGVAAVSTAYSIYSAEETKKNNAAIQKKSEEQQKKLETDAEDERKRVKATEERDAMARQLAGAKTKNNRTSVAMNDNASTSLGMNNSGTTILGG